MDINANGGNENDKNDVNVSVNFRYVFAFSLHSVLSSFLLFCYLLTVSLVRKSSGL